MRLETTLEMEERRKQGTLEILRYWKETQSIEKTHLRVINIAQQYRDLLSRKKANSQFPMPQEVLDRQSKKQENV